MKAVIGHTASLARFGSSLHQGWCHSGWDAGKRFVKGAENSFKAEGLSIRIERSDATDIAIAYSQISLQLQQVFLQ